MEISMQNLSSQFFVSVQLEVSPSTGGIAKMNQYAAIEGIQGVWGGKGNWKNTVVVLF